MHVALVSYCPPSSLSTLLDSWCYVLFVFFFIFTLALITLSRLASPPVLMSVFPLVALWLPLFDYS